MADNRREVTIQAVRQIVRSADIEVADETAQAEIAMRVIPVAVKQGESDHALTADRLTTSRKIALTGDVTGSIWFDGSKNVNLPSTVRTLTNMELELLLQ